MNNKKIVNFFSIVLISFPITSIYGIGISSFTLGDMLLLLTLFLCFIDTKIRNNKIMLEWSILPFFLYVLMFFLLNSFNYSSIEFNDILFRTSRYSLYLFTLIFFVNNYFDQQYGLKIFEKIVLFSSVLIIVQFFVLKYFNYYIKGYITFLPILREELVSFSEGIIHSNFQRVRSIFAEPAHYASYNSLFIAHSLFGNTSTSLKKSLLVTIGIIISASSTGIIIVLLLWSLWICNKIKNGIRKRYLISTIFVFLFSSVYLFNSSQFKLFSERISGKSTTGRLGSYGFLFDTENISFINRLFGKGMKDISSIVYLPGYPRMIFYFGYAGTLLFIYSLFKLYKNGDDLNKITIVLLSILNIGTVMVIGVNIMLFLPFSIQNKARLN